jgi:hypothetical protein
VEVRLKSQIENFDGGGGGGGRAWGNVRTWRLQPQRV